VQQTAVDNQPSAARTAKGPGALLREAREAAGMAPEALAQRLRLEPRVIEALEAEAYDRLPGPAFTKGYLRALAKELGIDPAPLLAQYTAQSNEAEPMLADFESRPPAQITSANARIKLISYALGVVVLILVAVWWQRHYASKVAAPAGDDPALAAEAVAPPEPSIPLPYTYTIVEHAGAPLAQPESWRRQTDGSMPPPEEDVLPALAAPAAVEPVASAAAGRDRARCDTRCGAGCDGRRDRAGAAAPRAGDGRTHPRGGARFLDRDHRPESLAPVLRPHQGR